MPTPPKSLNVSLAPELAYSISSRVASGRYHGARKVVRAALRLLEREEFGLPPESSQGNPRSKEESGGPPIQTPTRRGFGTRLIERSLAQDLDGNVSIEFAPLGLVCTVDAPLQGDL